MVIVEVFEPLDDSATEEDSNDTSPLLDLPSEPPLLPARNGKSPAPAIAANTSNDSVLQHHHSLQSSLVDSLSSMSSQLKQNSIKFSAALEKDKEVIESAQNKLGGNLGRMKKEGGRLSSYEKTSRSSTWFVIMAVSGVGIAWIMMFLLIKVS